jgi:biotin carboxyl carrier protein
MRYILVDQDRKDLVIQIDHFNRSENEFVIEGKINNKSQKRWLKEIAGKFFISSDKKTWKKVASFINTNHLASGTQIFKIFKGFKPSGLGVVNAGTLMTQMPGKVIRVNIKVGEKVKVGDTLFIIEAMKMENEIKAGVNGQIKSVNVQAGQTLESGYLLGEIEVKA